MGGVYVEYVTHIAHNDIDEAGGGGADDAARLAYTNSLTPIGIFLGSISKNYRTHNDIYTNYTGF